MKIGIVTYHRAHNHGAVLQAYALSTYLKKIGHIVGFVDYWPHYQSRGYDLIHLNILKTRNITTLYKLKFILKKIILFPFIFIRYYKYQQFIKNELKLSSRIKYRHSKNILDEYDIYIYGSDQIWRSQNTTEFKGYDPVYYGDYPENTAKKKITYAASMGNVNLDRSKTEYIKNKLSNYSVISAREIQLIDALTGLINNKIYHVIDPVFLLDTIEWSKLLKERKKRRKYILFYHLLLSDEATKLAKKIASRYDYDIIEIRGKIQLKEALKLKIHNYGPIDFLNLIYHADYVISTSFHGIAFSILFKKQFFAISIKNSSDRIVSLLQKTSLTERIIENHQDANIEVSIDYHRINDKLNEFINDSKKFIIKSLSES